MVMHALVLNCPSANLPNVCAILEETNVLQNAMLIAAVNVQTVNKITLYFFCVKVVHYPYSTYPLQTSSNITKY